MPAPLQRYCAAMYDTPTQNPTERRASQYRIGGASI
jgi:hypothetical protein